MAMNIGYQRAGWLGLVLGGICFIFPAALLTLGIAWAYVRYGRLPQAQGLLYGIKPVVLAIVFQALWNLGRTAFRTRVLVILGCVALVVSFLDLHPLFVLLGAGCASVAIFWIREPSTGKTPLARGGWLPLSMGAVSFPTVGLLSLFLFFLKLGAVLFGSGYVLLAFLKADLVDRWHWLTQAQLLDAIAVGQVTPGPVFTTATFIGYVLHGLPGAVVATVGIFLPSFVFVGLLGVVLPRLRKSLRTGAFLDGINVGAIALMVFVTWGLSRAALVDAWTGLLALASGILLLRFKVNPTWLVLGGAVVGLLIHR
jgi:chromate transporter